MGKRTNEDTFKRKRKMTKNFPFFSPNPFIYSREKQAVVGQIITNCIYVACTMCTNEILDLLYVVHLHISSWFDSMSSR